MGGSDPGQNVRLAAALTSAKKAHMPKDNVDNSIKKVCTLFTRERFRKPLLSPGAQV